MALSIAWDTPNGVVAGAVLIAVAAGVTYEELAQETGWTVERLQATVEAHPAIPETYACAKCPP